ncbi:fungal-specific transcription factor domain-containing protein [Dendryphion nanum]|uniref:Fungal-specific transcription factor domain-containing protein n=1 Tax=Dendryphion nanum TaxID=256645 RepID=A0A9P9EEI6_9PLEO|nr:fungal-specific transcription factor domain-containing protein [Dendryphion nanum]
MIANHNCWTCKERKVGCDRFLPECVNCKRSGRHCQGYALKLAWPDKVDGRRKQKKYQAQHVRSTDYLTRNGRFTFLNTTNEDFNDTIDFQRIVKIESYSRDEYQIRPALRPLSNINEEDGRLLSYFDSVLARMITTIDDNTNGFRLKLIPMALSSTDASSKSLLQAISALSSFHLGRSEEALQHKVKAIKSLSKSFQEGPSAMLTQFATCMMLCVYSVFDPSDTTWHTHLRGAKIIAEALGKRERDMLCWDFLELWLDYHETFSTYSYPADLSFNDGEPNIVLPESNDHNRQIIGPHGCSTEVLKIISCINQLRTLKSSSKQSPESKTQTFLELSLLIRSRLQTLSQEIRLEIGETSGTLDQTRILLTADFYRIATHLYLYQIAPPQAIPPNAVKELVKEGWSVLDQMEVCTSPWPLFILACNVGTDVERWKIMAMLEVMEERRGVGNYLLVRGLIQAVWMRADLGDRVVEVIDWRELVREGEGMPSFI